MKREKTYVVRERWPDHDDRGPTPAPGAVWYWRGARMEFRGCPRGGPKGCDCDRSCWRIDAAREAGDSTVPDLSRRVIELLPLVESSWGGWRAYFRPPDGMGRTLPSTTGLTAYEALASLAERCGILGEDRHRFAIEAMDRCGVPRGA